MHEIKKMKFFLTSMKWLSLLNKYGQNVVLKEIFLIALEKSQKCIIYKLN